MRWWTKGSRSSPEDVFLLIVVATFSQYDLALLDILDEETLASERSRESSPIYVADIQRYESIEQLIEDVPVAPNVMPQTPIAALWTGGKWKEIGSGKSGRDLVAKSLGLSPEVLGGRVVERAQPFRSIPSLG